ncbi:hypothetical protein [Paenibacillus sp. IHBB 3054]|uniref:hypothetical protein n=1 Tax=Paenibacillus sp. IHBB 3054 TaxID=3425689 RepID=UPI003F672532
MTPGQWEPKAEGSSQSVEETGKSKPKDREEHERRDSEDRLSKERKERLRKEREECERREREQSNTEETGKVPKTKKTDPPPYDREKILRNIEESKKAREASNFDKYLQEEKELLEKLNKGRVKMLRSLEQGQNGMSTSVQNMVMIMLHG